jgi:OCT family organic cation transporter-like MFS transporter 4/5
MWYKGQRNLHRNITKEHENVIIMFIIFFQWNLVCSRANLAALAQSLVLAGQGIGALIMSHLSDRFGRRTIHVLSHVAVLCCMIIMAFSKNIYMLLVLQLVTGSFQQVSLTTAIRGACSTIFSQFLIA